MEKAFPLPVSDHSIQFQHRSKSYRRRASAFALTLLTVVFLIYYGIPGGVHHFILTPIGKKFTH